MKRILTAVFAFMLIAGTADAQTKEHRQKGKITNELGLTEDQKSQMKQIHEAEKKELDALKANEKLSPEEAKQSRKAIQEKYRDQFRTVLTADQQEKAKDMRKGESKGKHVKENGERKESAQESAPKNAIARHRDGGQGSDQKEQKFEEELGLTAAQQASVAKSKEAFKVKAESIKNNEQLSKEEKQQAFKTLAEKHRDDMKAILTPEQQAKMESKKKGHEKRSKK